MKKRHRAIFDLLPIIVVSLACAEQLFAREVNLAPNLPYVDITYEGKQIRIERIQDTEHHLNNSFTKTSRPCPPFCIHPMQAAVGVETVGELELMDFLIGKVRTGEGLLIDSRLPEWFQKGTIPGSVNIPWTLLTDGPDNPHTARILMALGAVEDMGQWDFRPALHLMLFCNGPWCDQSPRAIQNLLALGYPPEKLHYYRGGMQLWQLLGLTTVVPTN
ncbi:sulfurtransferase [Halochromatium glycolicum]|uniref:Sulfurtransferase n=2 Tax=Halochromatium glycolicum TaxID=85075 RepID=A0AAJ0U237_9GAMM|nr:sulfurtransferase [Halochromatium glycolicum]